MPEQVGGRTFTLDALQNETIQNWMRDHDCPITNVGAIGGRFTFSFTPTSIGTVEKVQCACGEEIDVTDYNW